MSDQASRQFGSLAIPYAAFVLGDFLVTQPAVCGDAKVSISEARRFVKSCSIDAMRGGELATRFRRERRPRHSANKTKTPDGGCRTGC